MSYQIELRQQDISIRSMKYIVTLLVPDGRFMMGIGKWSGGNKKEAIKKAKEYAERYNCKVNYEWCFETTTPKRDTIKQ
jgi:ribosomal protein S5